MTKVDRDRLKNIARIHIVAILSCVIVAFVVGATAGLVHAQSPFIDSALKPTLAGEKTRPLSRGANIQELYHQGNRMVTQRLDIERLMQEDAAQAKPGPLRMGVVQEVGQEALEKGQWTELDGGGSLWTMAFHAPGAVGIRLRIRPWSPPFGAELIVYDAYNPDHALGSFSLSTQVKTKEFWTPTIYSDEVRVEYYLPPEIDHLTPDSQITIDGVLNQYRGFTSGNDDQPEEANCHLDVACYPAWDAEAAGVAALSLISNQFGFFCSGSMMNRMPQDFTPLFQTARHCGVTEANVDTVLVTWFYQMSGCPGVLPNLNTLPQTTGVALLVDDGNADYSLIGLASDTPGGIGYLGWNAGYWSNDSEATGIHHPGGSYKRISFGDKTGDAPCMSGSGWEIIYPQGNGLTEPGSSGSPVLDSAHRVRGTLSGCDYVGNPNCNNDSRGVYGRFDVAWPTLQPFLFPSDPLNIYADSSFTGAELGTVTNPFRSVLKSVFAVQNGGNVYIEQGSYDERLTIDKPMTLHSQNGTAKIGE